MQQLGSMPNLKLFRIRITLASYQTMRMLRPWHSLAAPWHWPSSSRLQRTQRLRRHQSSAERLNIPIRICGSTITQDKKFGTWGQNWDLFRTISKLWSQSRSNLIFGTSRKHGLHNCGYTKFITSVAQWVWGNTSISSTIFSVTGGRFRTINATSSSLAFQGSL